VFKALLSATHDLLESISRTKLQTVNKSLRSLLNAIEGYFHR
jgi:hypothetical protein